MSKIRTIPARTASEITKGHFRGADLFEPDQILSLTSGYVELSDFKTQGLANQY